jgi:hypothetical protein
MCAGNATEVQNGEIWADLTQIIADTDNLKHLFRDYCKSDVVESPISDMYHDTMSVPLEDRQGLLLVCRDNALHAEEAIECAPLPFNTAC